MFFIPVESSRTGKSSSKEEASLPGLATDSLEGSLEITSTSRSARSASFASLLASQPAPLNTSVSAGDEEVADPEPTSSLDVAEKILNEAKPALTERGFMREHLASQVVESAEEDSKDFQEPPAALNETVSNGSQDSAPPDAPPAVLLDAEETETTSGTGANTVLPLPGLSESEPPEGAPGETESTVALLNASKSTDAPRTASVSIGFGETVAQSTATRLPSQPNVVEAAISSEAEVESKDAGAISLEGLESDENLEIDPATLKRVAQRAGASTQDAAVASQTPSGGRVSSEVEASPRSRANVEVDAAELKPADQRAPATAPNVVVTPQAAVNRPVISEPQASARTETLEGGADELSETETDADSGGEEGLGDKRSSQEREGRQFAQGRDAEPARPSTSEPARVVRTARETVLTNTESSENHVEKAEDAESDADGTSTAQEGNRMAEPQNKPTHTSPINEPLSGESARVESVRDGKESAAATVTSAQEVNAGRPVVRAEAGSSVTVPSTYEAAVANAERISRMIVRETAVLRQSGAESMTAILRPDAKTEMVVNMRRVDGTLEATIKVERGDFAGLNQQWSQLQDRLAQQNIRLAPLEEAPSRFESGSREDDARSGNSENADDNPTHTRRAANIERGEGTEASAEANGKSDDVPQHADGRSKWETWA